MELYPISSKHYDFLLDFLQSFGYHIDLRQKKHLLDAKLYIFSGLSQLFEDDRASNGKLVSQLIVKPMPQAILEPLDLPIIKRKVSSN